MEYSINLYKQSNRTVGVGVFSDGPLISDIKIGGSQPITANKFQYLGYGITLRGNVKRVSINSNIYEHIFGQQIFVSNGANIPTDSTVSKASPLITGNSENILQGTAGANNKIAFYLSNETGKDAIPYIGSTVATNGTWSFDLSNCMPVSTSDVFNIVAMATDAAGNSSKFSSGYAFRIAASPLIPQAPAQNDQNYIVTNTYLKEGKKTLQDIALLPVEEVQQSITYLDGLGRNVQSVITQGSPSKKDIVQPTVYDALGREPRQYLPYTKDNNGFYKPSAITDQLAFYGNEAATAGKYEATPFPYADKVFDNSPLNKVLEQGAPGADWQVGQNHTIRVEERTNVAGEVLLWTIDETNGINTNTTYAAGQLFVQSGIDENQHKTLEFKDKLGKVVCKKVQYNQTITTDLDYASTYYLYDDFGQLRCVVPPEAFKYKNLATIQEGWESEFMVDWCYAYRYDARQRLAAKRLPGTAWQYMVYNLKDQLIMSQEGNQRLDFKWKYIKYDALGRPVQSGVYTHASLVSQEQMQILANAVSTQFENITGVNITTQFGYSIDQSFPKLSATNSEIISVNYYDDYDFNRDGTDDVSFLPSSLIVSKYTVDNTGQITGGAVRVLGTNTFLRSVIFYDDKGIVVQTQEDNYLGGKEVATILQDFSGKVLQTEQRHNITGTTPAVTVKEAYTYDHAARKLSTTHQINNNAKITLSTQGYNEPGEAISKKLHSSDKSNYLQTVDYRYNIRGWLKSINDAALTDSKDLFGMELKYNNNFATGLTTPQYNGNISEIVWNSPRNNGKQSAYAFSYDPMGRLLNAQYALKSATGFDSKLGNYNEDNITYDRNGNIQTLQRHADLSNVKTIIDQLSYKYKGNKLIQVNDIIAGSAVTDGFIDKVKQEIEYTYDANGNMIEDKNKIMTLQYNLLNLPQQFDFSSAGNIKYIYDGMGRKLQKTITINGSFTTSDYVNGFEYQSVSADATKKLQRFSTEEGMVTVSGNLFKYEYCIKDHLGNIRARFGKDNNGLVDRLQEEDYYPFGLSHSNSVLRTDKSKYLYNNKELQEELGLNLYDYGARFYDPQLGRWHVVDPLTELSRKWSPYTYCYNNPARFIDPDGMYSTEEWKKDNGVKDSELINVYKSNSASAEDFDNSMGPLGGDYGSVINQNGGDEKNKKKENKKEDKKKEDKDNDKQDSQDETEERNPNQDKVLTPGDIMKLKDYGWNHRDKGAHGGQTDLYKDREGNVYQKPKGGRGFGEPIGINLNNLETSLMEAGLGVGAAIILYEVLKWGTAVILAPETGGLSIGGALALP